MNRALWLGLLLSVLGGAAKADTITIDVTLDGPADGTYRLAGQSAFIQTRTGSGTSGGQLDGVPSGATVIGFSEFFPPPSLADYLGFAYFGIFENVDIFDDVIDTSLVVAFVPGSGVGQTIDAHFAYTEAQLVTAFTTGLDSPEFLDMLSLVPANAATLGDIAVPPIGRPGTTLDLVAFIGGPDGDVGVKVGTLAVTVVPEPSSIVLAITACGILAIVRSHFRRTTLSR